MKNGAATGAEADAVEWVSAAREAIICLEREKREPLFALKKNRPTGGFLHVHSPPASADVLHNSKERTEGAAVRVQSGPTPLISPEELMERMRSPLHPP